MIFRSQCPDETNGIRLFREIRCFFAIVNLDAGSLTRSFHPTGQSGTKRVDLNYRRQYLSTNTISGNPVEPIDHRSTLIEELLTRQEDVIQQLDDLDIRLMATIETAMGRTKEKSATEVDSSIEPDPGENEPNETRRAA